MTYDSAKKKNELMIQATTRMNFKHIMLGLRSQTQKNRILYDFIHTKRKGKSIKEKANEQLPGTRG